MFVVPFLNLTQCEVGMTECIIIDKEKDIFNVLKVQHEEVKLSLDIVE